MIEAAWPRVSRRPVQVRAGPVSPSEVLADDSSEGMKITLRG